MTDKYTDLDNLPEIIARHIFEIGDEANSPAQRMQYMGGKWSNNEIAQGGVCEKALAKYIGECLADVEKERAERIGIISLVKQLLVLESRDDIDFFCRPTIKEVFKHLEQALSQVADSKECEHGKGLTDYCQPCGRVNGG